ncbi:MAG: peptidylprolyl isomerase [Terracidiphilus sp.]
MNLKALLTPSALVLCAMLLPGSALAQTPTAQTPYGGEVVEQIIARVNDQIITSSDYDRALKDMEQEDQQRGATMQQQSEDRQNLLRGLIDQQLWLSKGKQLGITGDTELIKRLDDIRKQYHLASMEDLQKAAQEQGVSYADFQANIRNQIITQDVMRQEVGSTINITPGEARAYYDEHKQDYTQPESVHLSEILISTGSGSADSTDDPKKVASAKAKAENIEAKLNAGGDFAQLARTFSDGPTAAGGGDLGTYKRGQLPAELENDTFSLKTGQWTAPILTRQGWIVLKVVDHTPAGPAPYDQVQDQVEDALYMNRMEPAIRQYLNTMRDQAAIWIAPGYQDTGATQAELHPTITFSAYTPPAPKKKKKVERTRFRETPSRFRQKGPVSAPTEAPAAAQAATANAAPAGNATARKKNKKRNKKEEASVEKPGKREKIRFGQKPRETLPAASTDADTTPPLVENAGALPETASAGQEPANPLETAPPEHKTRYSDLARKDRHHKKTKAAPVQEFNATPPTPAEVAGRQMQSAPLEGSGKAKKKKRTAKGKKERYTEAVKKANQQAQPQPTFTPSAPVEGAPAPANAPKPQ